MARTRPTRARELVLVSEARVADLFPAGGAGRMEASGVLTVDDGFLLVFDDSRNIGRIGRDLSDARDNRVITPSGDPATMAWDGFENVALDPVRSSGRNPNPGCTRRRSSCRMDCGSATSAACACRATGLP